MKTGWSINWDDAEALTTHTEWQALLVADLERSSTADGTDMWTLVDEVQRCNTMVTINDYRHASVVLQAGWHTFAAHFDHVTGYKINQTRENPWRQSTAATVRNRRHHSTCTADPHASCALPCVTMGQGHACRSEFGASCWRLSIWSSVPISVLMAVAQSSYLPAPVIAEQ